MEKTMVIGIASHLGAGATSVLTRVSALLATENIQSSIYSWEDYIRGHFKKLHGKTPANRQEFNEFIKSLTKDSLPNFTQTTLDFIINSNQTGIHFIDTIRSAEEKVLLQKQCEDLGIHCTVFSVKSVYQDCAKRLPDLLGGATFVDPKDITKTVQPVRNWSQFCTQDKTQQEIAELLQSIPTEETFQNDEYCIWEAVGYMTTAIMLRLM